MNTNKEELAAKTRAALTTKVIMSINHYDINKIITEFFTSREIGTAYGCVCYEEWNNDSKHSFDLKKEDLDLDQQEIIGKAKNGEWEHFSLCDYLQELVNNDVIPEGKLLIEKTLN